MDPRVSMEGDPREQIARLESEIEALSESAARCAKIAISAQITIGAGCLLFAAMLVGLLYPDALRLLIATICAMGGIVLYGSNRTTANQIAARIADAERLRAEFIGGIELTLVPQPSRVLH
jgi:Flp pilus assembly protein TadB